MPPGSSAGAQFARSAFRQYFPRFRGQLSSRVVVSSVAVLYSDVIVITVIVLEIVRQITGSARLERRRGSSLSGKHCACTYSRGS